MLFSKKQSRNNAAFRALKFKKHEFIGAFTGTGPLPADTAPAHYSWKHHITQELLRIE